MPTLHPRSLPVEGQPLKSPCPCTKETDPEYQTAERLLELLKCSMPVPSEYIPKTSILREFIGESYFE